MRAHRFLPIVLAAAVCASAPAAQPPPTDGPAGEDAARPRREWLPEGSLYAPYLAEINRPGLGVTVLGVADPDVPGSGDLRFGLKLGGRFGLLRINPRGADRDGGRSWQLSLGAGFYGQFDVDNSLDNVGWDGLYSLVLSNARTAARPGAWAGGDAPAFRIGAQHWSSHVGDEYAERTGRRRIGYTREELVAGVSWPFGRGLRTYAEAAYGYTGRAEDEIGNELQEPGRVQWGIEVESPGSLGSSPGGSPGSGGRWGWYAAFDATAYEERDWEPNLTLGLGFLADGGQRRWRAGITLYDGRTPLGEFFRSDESYALVGLWLDLERPAPPPSRLR